MLLLENKSKPIKHGTNFREKNPVFHRLKVPVSAEQQTNTEKLLFFFEIPQSKAGAYFRKCFYLICF